MKISPRFVLCSAAVAAMFLPAAAQTSNPPANPPATINQRKENQQDRIANGVASGQLTAGETSNLERKESNLNKEEKLMRSEFAVVLLDVSMPDMDGFEAARLIHAHPRFERTPIILITGVHV